MKGLRLLVVTSLHRDFDTRIWRHVCSAARLGCEVELLCPWDVRDGEVIEGVRMRTFSPASSRVARIWQTPSRMTPPLVRAIRRAQLVHFHDLDLLPFMALAARFRPVVYDVHENYPEEMRSRAWIPDYLRPTLSYLVRVTQWWLARSIGNVVFVVPEQRADFPRTVRRLFLHNFASIHMFPAGVKRRKPKKQPLRVLFTGSQYRENGSELLLDIIEFTRDRQWSIQFIVVDKFQDAEYRAWIMRQCRERDLMGSIEWVERVPSTELASLLAYADVGLQCNLDVPKQRQAMATKLFEFMAAGLAIVSTDLPRQRAIVSDNEVGLMARSGDAAHFAEQLGYLDQNRDQCLQMGENGRRVFKEQYTWESQEANLDAFYQAIIHGHHFRDSSRLPDYTGCRSSD